MTRTSVVLAVAGGLVVCAALGVIVYLTTRTRPPRLPLSPTVAPRSAEAMRCANDPDLCWMFIVAAWDGGDPDAERALEQAACDAGRRWGCDLIDKPSTARSAWTSENDRVLAFNELLCAMEQAVSCSELAALYRFRGRAAEATAMTERACGLGHLDSCATLGNQIVDGANGRPASAGFELLDKACSGGVRSGCHGKAIALLRGKGVARDPASALSLLERICGDDWLPACSDLGVAWENGDAGAVDLPKAFTYYERACDKGSGDGCYNLGLALTNGIGAKKDPARAAQSFEKACAAHIHCGRWAEVLRQGRGVPADAKRADDVLVAACKSGLEPTACEAAAPP